MSSILNKNNPSIYSFFKNIHKKYLSKDWLKKTKKLKNKIKNRQIQKYIKRKNNNNKIAIVTCNINSYDDLRVHDVLNPEFDYIVYTDNDIDDHGFLILEKLILLK